MFLICILFFYCNCIVFIEWYAVVLYVVCCLTVSVVFILYGVLRFALYFILYYMYGV